MPMYVLNRDHTLSTTRGHRIAFKKGVAVSVPNIVVADAVAIGATPADGSEPNVLPDARPVNEKEHDPIQRQQATLDAIRDVLQLNDRDEFTAGGAPHLSAVVKRTGFKLTERELAEQWQEYQNISAGV